MKLEADLASVIEATTTEQHPEARANRLLSRTHPVGWHEAGFGVRWDPSVRAVYQDQHTGDYARPGTKIDRISNPDELEQWIKSQPWAWLHPRHIWIFEDEVGTKPPESFEPMPWRPDPPQFEF